MGRSVKKGPYVQEALYKRIVAMNEAGEKRVLKTWEMNAPWFWVNTYWNTKRPFVRRRRSFTYPNPPFIKTFPTDCNPSIPVCTEKSDGYWTSIKPNGIFAAALLHVKNIDTMNKKMLRRNS